MRGIRTLLTAILVALFARPGVAHAHEFVPSQMLIRADGIGQEVARATLANAGYPVTFVHDYPVFTTTLYSFDNPLTGDDIPTVRALLDELVAKSSIQTGDFNVPMAIDAGGGATGSLWVTGMSLGDFQSQYARGIIGTDAAANRATGLGVKVAIIDSGLTSGAPISSGYALPYGYSVNNGVATSGEVPLDEGNGKETDSGVGHGTFVAALISCTAPAARHLHIKVLDDEGRCLLADVIAALEVAINENVHVANMSLIPSLPTATLASAIRQAREHGIIVVASAGNNNPAVNPYQGCEPDLIQVGATNHLDQPFTFVTPAWVDIHAPGASSMPVNGLPTAAEAVVGPLGIGPNKEPIFAASTSSDLATAFVSGAAAAFRAANPDWPNAQVPADNIAQRFIDAARSSAATVPGGANGSIKRLAADSLVAPLPRVPQCPDDPVAEELKGGYQYVINSADLGLLLSSWSPFGSDPRRIERANLSRDAANKIDSEDLGILLSLWASPPPPGCE